MSHFTVERGPKKKADRKLTGLICVECRNRTALDLCFQSAGDQPRRPKEGDTAASGWLLIAKRKLIWDLI